MLKVKSFFAKLSFKAKIVLYVCALALLLLNGTTSNMELVGKFSSTNFFQNEVNLSSNMISNLLHNKCLEDGENYVNLKSLITNEVEKQIFKADIQQNLKIAIYELQSNDFICIVSDSTDENIKKLEGKNLNNANAIDSLRKGESFDTKEKIENSEYIVSYYPIKINQQVIGAVSSNILASKTEVLAKEYTDAKRLTVLSATIVMIIIFVVLILRSIDANLTKRLLKVLEMLKVSVGKVRDNSDAIRNSGNDFAQGSKEQACSIEQISSSIEETSSMISQTAEGADKTAKLAETLSSVVDEGDQNMLEMNDTIAKIKDSSTEIGKIINIIDDIASQTNILALNAAVEAARVGELGKGFAVVAEEVRNLAQKSANAVKDSTNIIENNITLSLQGVEVAQKVTTSLKEIRENVMKVATIAKESAEASLEESKGIEQVTDSIKIIEKTSMGTAEKAQANVEYGQSLNNEMENVITAMNELNRILGNK